MNFTSKLPNVGVTIFTRINVEAQRHQAINLAQGFPGFLPDAELLDSAAQAFKGGHNQYAPLRGVLSLRSVLCEKMEKLYGHKYDPEKEITLTAGGTQALFTAITAFVHRDDEVIVFKPAYDCYEPAIELCGGVSVQIEMNAPEYKIDWNLVKAKISSKTRMIILNNPHNPSGRILAQNDLETLQELVRDTNIIVLGDEVYEHIVYDQKKHESIARYPELAARSLLVYSFGKTLHVTGWKLGYCLAPEFLMTEFRKVHQYNVFCVNHPLQLAIRDYLMDPKHYLELPEFYQQKRDFFLSAIKGSRLTFLPAQGTYFQTVSYTNISDEKDTDFALYLIREHHLATIPVSVFHKNGKDEKMLRICFAKNEDTLGAAAEIINRL